MLNLNQMYQGIRKAAAMSGIWSGKVEIFSPETPFDTIVKVYNKNHEDGFEILAGEAENALNYTWQEIKNRR